MSNDPNPLDDIDLAEAADLSGIDIEGLQEIMVKDKMQEQMLLQESMAHGGPGSINEAILVLMTKYKVGFRQLAVASGINRKKLQAMIEGETDMSPEAAIGIATFFEKYDTASPQTQEQPKPTSKLKAKMKAAKEAKCRYRS